MLINIDLKDRNGNETDIDDEIRAILPEVDIPSYNNDPEDEGFYAPERVVIGTLKFYLSKGIYLKITEIIKDETNCHHIGQIIRFKFKKWQWDREGK